MEKPYGPRVTVAIDGPSGAGKSTVAREVARRIGALYLDTGAMYRAVGLYMTRLGIDPRDAAAVSHRVSDVQLDIRHVDGVQRVYLADEDVTDAIRTPEMSMAASAVSAAPAVRERLVALQQAIARGRSVVMDGRDIGTKVLPDATLKVFLTAPVEIRARRRQVELAQKGLSESFERVLAEMRQRDLDDATRAASPLQRADDALLLDGEDRTFAETVEQVLTLIEERLRTR